MSKKKNRYKEYDNMSMDDVISSYVTSKMPKRSLNEILDAPKSVNPIKEETIGDIVGNILKNRETVTKEDGTTIDVTTQYPKDLDVDPLTPVITPDEANSIEAPVIEEKDSSVSSDTMVKYEDGFITISNGFRNIKVDIGNMGTSIDNNIKDSTLTDMIIATMFCVVSEFEPNAIYYIDDFSKKFGKITSFDSDKFLFILEDELNIVLCYHITDSMYNNFMSTYGIFNEKQLVYITAKTVLTITSDNSNSFVETLYSNTSAIEEYMDKMNSLSDEFYQIFIDDDKTNVTDVPADTSIPEFALTNTRTDLRNLLAEICNTILPSSNESEGVSNDNEPFHDGEISDDIREEHEEVKKEKEKIETEEIQKNETSIDEINESHITFDDVIDSTDDDADMVIPVIKG